MTRSTTPRVSATVRKLLKQHEPGTVKRCCERCTFQTFESTATLPVPPTEHGPKPGDPTGTAASAEATGVSAKTEQTASGKLREALAALQEAIKLLDEPQAKQAVVEAFCRAAGVTVTAEALAHIARGGRVTIGKVTAEGKAPASRSNPSRSPAVQQLTANQIGSILRGGGGDVQPVKSVTLEGGSRNAHKPEQLTANQIASILRS